MPGRWPAESGPSAPGSRVDVGQHPSQRGFELVEAFAGWRATPGKSPQLSKPVPASSDLVAAETSASTHPGDAYSILGDRNEAMVDAKQVEDGKMFKRLRHGAIVGGDNEKSGIDDGDSGQHVVDKADMTGHIDKADAMAADGGIRKPRSMVSPRVCSASRRSVDAGQRVRTSRVLP
ncbi:MAG: hypothetical protein U5O39_11720 [Gammaproteobacteria bacterium]|nr:hypothetical protein [Gammaproteobacteria bacterium]